MKPKKENMNEQPFHRAAMAKRKKEEKEQIGDLEKRIAELYAVYEKMPQALREAPAGTKLVKMWKLMKEQIRAIKKGLSADSVLASRSLPWKNERDPFYRSKSFRDD